MKHNLYGCGCIVIATLAFTASPAAAATTAAGPYYATPSWDQQLPASTRFVVLSNWGNGNEAVLDRETGLVWEQSPSTSTSNWFVASLHCLSRNSGGRTGWRLPTVQDLASLLDPTQTNPSLPSGHPFTVQSSFYWSASTIVTASSNAWVVDFNGGLLDNGGKSIFDFPAWCVRGGPGVDAQ